MSQQHPRSLQQAQAALEQATKEAKELVERLGEDLRQQTEEREQHRLVGAGATRRQEPDR